MKVYASPDEMYPVYTLDKEIPYEGFDEPAIELTEEEVREYQEVERVFAAWQKRISALIQKARSET